MLVLAFKFNYYTYIFGSSQFEIETLAILGSFITKNAIGIFMIKTLSVISRFQELPFKCSVQLR